MIRLKLPPHLTEEDLFKFSETLAGLAQAHWIVREDDDKGKPWMLSWITPEKPDETDLKARLSVMAEIQGIQELAQTARGWSIEKIPENIDWLAESYRQFPPFTIGPFFIYGSHYEGDIPQDSLSLKIDAATAFGSGEHGTTRGCLNAMLDLKSQGVCPWYILDMGTGSGILAIAAWKLWKTPILAVDVDDEAVRVAERHREFNRVPEDKTGLICVRGNGFTAEIVQQKKPFELILANILAGALKEMAGDLSAVLDDNGYVILSGILNEQAMEVMEAYEMQGLVLKNRYDIDEWSTLVMHKG